ncbi:MAG TPA: hypothetical protein VM715_04920 [Candidatus Acidoferrum sp.]|nr:hypothetical protein [Candidatus Acidoferrum sp.]
MSNDSEQVMAFTQHLVGLFQAVDEEADERHMEGGEKYGQLKFLGVDTLQEALEEVLDLINYARYTAVKIKLLQEYLAQQATALESDDTTGGGFIPTSEMFT